MSIGDSSVRYLVIDGFPNYQVGDDGSVLVQCHFGERRTGRWKPLKQIPSKKGYLSVNLVYAPGRYRTFRVHRLVLTAFVGPCPQGMECRHLDDVKSHNWLANLEWGTREQNRDDCRRNGGYSNKPRNRMFFHDGQTLSLKEWATKLNVPYKCLHQRIGVLDWPFAKAISVPFLGVSANGHER